MVDKEKVKLIAGFDGSCPRSKDAFERKGRNNFIVYPSRRNGISEEKSGNGFRLGIELVNEGIEEAEITLHIDWEDEDRKYMHLRDYVFVKEEKEEDWRMVPVSDKAHQTIKKILDEVMPALFLNIHNWMFKYKDGLLCLDGNFAEKVRFYMPDQVEVYKKWSVETLDTFITKNQVPGRLINKSWKNYCEENFNSIDLCCEFPWFARNGKIMRQTGVKILKAVLMAYLT